VLFRFVLLFALFERDGLFTFGWGPLPWRSYSPNTRQFTSLRASIRPLRWLLRLAGYITLPLVTLLWLEHAMHHSIASIGCYLPISLPPYWSRNMHNPVLLIALNLCMIPLITMRRRLNKVPNPRLRLAIWAHCLFLGRGFWPRGCLSRLRNASALFVYTGVTPLSRNIGRYDNVLRFYWSW